MADRNFTAGRRFSRLVGADGMELIVPNSDVVTVRSFGRIDPFTYDSATQDFPLGTKLIYGDRVFRYVLNGGTAGVAGNLYQSVVPLAGHIAEAINTAVAGDKTISFTPNTVTTDDLAANEIADGYIHIVDDTGAGHMYKIKSHPAITGGQSGVLTLFDPIDVTVAAASVATVQHNPWRKVIIHPSPPTAMVVGVMVAALTANQYGWVQVEGPCAVLTDGTLVIGTMVMPSDGTDGAVEQWVPETDTTGEVESMGPIGWTIAVDANAKYSAIWLKGLP